MCIETLDTIARGRKQFARLLREWQRRGGWAQDTPAKLATELGWPHGPHNSQWSLAVRNRLDPKPLFFHSLGWLNARIQEAPALPISWPLKRRVLLQDPVMHEGTDRIWTASDFAACFLGELDPPSWTTEAGERQRGRG